MDGRRRDILKTGGGLVVLAAAGLVRPRVANAQQWNQAAFTTKNLNDAIKAMGGANATESKEIRFINPTPDIAENGAVVPITITSDIPRTQSIAILVEKNPNILTASFDIPEGTEAFVSTRLKMGETSNVVALVKADGRFYFAKKEVKVTLGGCGG